MLSGTNLSIPLSSPSAPLKSLGIKFEHDREKEEESLKHLKVSYQSIKNLFPKCLVKIPILNEQKTTTKNVGLGGEEEAKRSRKVKAAIPIKQEFQKSEILKDKLIIKDEYQDQEVHSSAWKDQFIEVEWDSGGVGNHNDPQEERIETEMKNGKPNVIVREILVLKPKWLTSTKKVLLRDCRVNLINFEEQQKFLKAHWEKKRAQQKQPPKEEESEEGSTPSLPSSLTNNLARYPEEREKTNDGNAFKIETKIVNKQSRFDCDLCGESFRHNYTLFRHLIQHLGEQPYKCDTCGKRFRTSQKLHRHKRVHTGERPFKCSVCGKRFRRSEHVSDHVRIHIRENYVKKIKDGKYECTECKEQFSHMYQIKIHVGFAHTGEGPYSCKCCKRDFLRSCHLLRHVKQGICSKSQTKINIP